AGSSSSLDGAIDLEAELAKLRSPEARKFALTAAHAVANVDGQCSAEEYALLRRIHAALAIDAAPDIEVVGREWAAKMGDAREEIARATTEFLHEVARLGDGS